MIFLDHASTTPMSTEALEIYKEAAESYYGNTGSLHESGYHAARLTEASRAEIARAIGANPEEVYFTGGGTEGNFRAILSLVLGADTGRKRIVTSSVEHPSVLSVCHYLQERGYEVIFLPVSRDGIISISELKHNLTLDTALVSIQHVNSETGTVQPVEEIGSLCQSRGVLFHSDAVQSFGKMPIKALMKYADSLTFSAHKVQGPKGTGAVYIREGTPWKCPDPYTSPSHERGFRPGTVDTPSIAAFGAAVSKACSELEANRNHMDKLRRFFITMIRSEVPEVKIEGHAEHCAPHIVGLRLPGIEGQYVMLSLDRYGICVSTGSACQVARQEASHVLSSLGKSDQEAREFFRVSIGITTTYKDLTQTAGHLKTLAASMKKEA
ncbi:cysteine desulfurase family protein [Alteribacter natronophilus]|uniref:cysteine desulfurase family protein n=1 Tax=Alteribacter natronophilus TaxID=2583810 RepID=UPI00110F0285|nr:IscS subfamily cysteine desulfurase [Alteribacter natronophilus]TMW70271.1 aminotransferase class V-fold PLP-dependent enzyme [Alteribacter natronophilus]